MFGLGWTELLVIGIVALIVVGPEDLPQMFRAVGRFTGKARGMAREFSRAMEDAADQSGVRDINKTIRAAANPGKFGTDSLKHAAGLGPETERLSQERLEAKRKIEKRAAEMAEERMAREAREREAAEQAAVEEADDEAEAALEAAMAESAGARPAETLRTAPEPAPKSTGDETR
ncbi:Sec-independent protein translocase protein TatB [Histidinibacterium lentulum]|uniref:Sec-independent protein translocase protein TatB n=1 Tax=Histidinibacterium lentulum TaxID=2480588 RepID=A0A3N2QLP7_9RHOB|nr:Sec-independent protein translocase protein TatB [Histidinibacterium lentulum]ROT96117.1 twin-arginine translocase subunit TatB [Histidinibacterium lentulum]